MAKKVIDPAIIQQANDTVIAVWENMRDRMHHHMFNGGPYEKEFTAIHNFFKDSYGFTFF
jgi:hypothetical protein